MNTMNMVVQWLALLPHNKQISGFGPAGWFPPIVQRNVHWVNWLLQIAHRCLEDVCVCV